ncbi:MAG: NYN domain-containing protein [Planctomycetes bacterium]|nr:NYN domain-containing protein [Planctomycetota bacterium]
MLDFDNVVLGLPAKTKFQPQAIIDRVLEHGKILYKRAYADWSRYEKHRVALHELGFDLLEIPKRRMTGKNSADIRMVVDAMELVISQGHIDTFALVTGDSDFTPVVASLRMHDKHVIGIGVKDSSSKLLINSCDEFIFYEELDGVSVSRARASANTRERLARSQKVTKPRGGEGADDKEGGKRRAEGLFLLMDATRALLRTNDSVWASQVKQTLVRKHPTFSESFHGYTTFSEMIRDGVELGVLEGKRHDKNGNWLLSGIGTSGDK